MRRIFVTLFAFIAGCSSQSSVETGDCGVYFFDGQLTNALITPTPEMKKLFLDQLEERNRDLPYCWYQTENGEIELSVGDYGHFFVSDNGLWKYDEARTYIIIWHERR